MYFLSLQRSESTYWVFLPSFAAISLLVRPGFSLTTCRISAYIAGWWNCEPKPTRGGKTGSFT